MVNNHQGRQCKKCAGDRVEDNDNQQIMLKSHLLHHDEIYILHSFGTHFQTSTLSGANQRTAVLANG